MSALLASGWALQGACEGLPPPVLAPLVGRGRFWLALALLLQHMAGPGLCRVSVATGAVVDGVLPAVLGRAEGSQLSLLPVVSWSQAPVGLC